jgi:hypothetical protein
VFGDWILRRIPRSAFRAKRLHEHCRLAGTAGKPDSVRAKEAAIAG